MKKQILNLGKALNKAEQKSINGGDLNDPLYSPHHCDFNTYPATGCREGLFCITGICRAL